MLILNAILAIVLAHVASLAIQYTVTLGSTFMVSFSVALFAVDAIMLTVGGMFSIISSLRLAYGPHHDPRSKAVDQNDGAKEKEGKKTGWGTAFLIAGLVVFLESLLLVMLIL